MCAPRSHKNNFVRPPELYGNYGMGSRARQRSQGAGAAANGEDSKSERPTGLPTSSMKRQGMMQLTAKAGTIVLMPEATTHGVLPWYPKDRARWVIGLRYQSQHLGGSIEFDDDTLERLSPNTRELLQYAHYTYTKAIARMPVVTLLAPDDAAESASEAVARL